MRVAYYIYSKLLNESRSKTTEREGVANQQRKIAGDKYVNRYKEEEILLETLL